MCAASWPTYGCRCCTCRPPATASCRRLHWLTCSVSCRGFKWSESTGRTSCYKLGQWHVRNKSQSLSVGHPPLRIKTEPQRQAFPQCVHAQQRTESTGQWPTHHSLLPVRVAEHVCLSASQHALAASFAVGAERGSVGRKRQGDPYARPHPIGAIGQCSRGGCSCSGAVGHGLVVIQGSPRVAERWMAVGHVSRLSASPRRKIGRCHTLSVFWSVLNEQKFENSQTIAACSALDRCGSRSTRDRAFTHRWHLSK